MKLKKFCTTAVVSILAFALVEVTFSLNAHAAGMMIATNEVVANVARTEAQQKVHTFLNRMDVQTELLKRGVQPKEAQERVAALSDFELQNLAGKIDTAPAGADVIVISLTTLLLVVIILLLIAK